MDSASRTIPDVEGRPVKVGHWLSPEQHVLQAKHVGHAVDAVIAVEEVSKQAIQVCMSLSDYELEQQ